MSSKKVKLLHIAQSAGYGVTIYVETLIKSLNSDKFEQCLLASEYYHSKRFEDIVSNLTTIHMDRNISKEDLRTIMKCREIIKLQAPDIVYCHSAKAGIYGRLACLGTGMKVVYNPHGWAFNMKCPVVKKMSYRLVEAMFACVTDCIIAISDFEKKSTPWYIPSSKIRVIKNGIDVKHCQNVLLQNSLTRESTGIPKDAFVVGIVARISVQKGQDMLVEIAEKVKNWIPKAFFVIVGGKSDDIDIETLLEKKSLSDAFLITGEVQDAIRYASLFDVAVLTSRWEGFGLVLLEYMVAQKPIVAFSVDAIPEIVIDGYNGLLVQANDTKAFEDAIIRLHENKELIGHLTTNASDRVKSFFDLERVAKEHEDLFLELYRNK